MFLTFKMSLCNPNNWCGYKDGFNKSFQHLEEELVDPSRFPRDSRDENGFWVLFKVFKVHGYFQCSVDPSCSWQSQDIQVDVLIRYNFKQKRGEMKIDREFRQRCGLHGGDLVYPQIGNTGGAKWVMMKTMNYIRKRFYQDPDMKSKQRNNSESSLGSSSSSASLSWSTSGRRSSSSSQSGRSSRSNISSVSDRYMDFGYYGYCGYAPDHYRQNCEACMMGRCPFPMTTVMSDRQFYIRGYQAINVKNLTFINWCFLNFENVKNDPAPVYVNQ